MPIASPRRSPIPRRIACGVVAGGVIAVAVPVVQGAMLALTDRPPVPGPHDQDGLVPSAADCHEPLELVWLGDSLASGVGATTADEAFPRKAAALYCDSDSRSVTLTCLAREGACTADVLANQVPVALRLLGPSSVVVVTVGSNDVGSLTQPRRFRRDYDTVLTALAATGATVVAVGLPDIGSAMVIRQPLRALARWVGRNADRHIQRLARARGAHFVSIDNRAQGASPVTYLAADRYHPNNDTYRLWAGRVAALLTLAVATSTIQAGAPLD